MNRKTLLQYLTTCLIMTIGGYFLSYLLITSFLPANQISRMQDTFETNKHNCITLNTPVSLTNN
ncbi:MAG: hypothetical protein IPM42_14310 [Saprospiraceae bacterium]|nr:hypothetical protein [Saprospiraceae bacterium]